MSDAMPSSPRPQYYVTRPDGTLVPLIALDEFPQHVSVQGIPSIITVFQAVGMTNAGVSEASHLPYVFDGVYSNGPHPLSSGPDPAPTKAPATECQELALTDVPAHLNLDMSPKAHGIHDKPTTGAAEPTSTIVLPTTNTHIGHGGNGLAASMHADAQSSAEPKKANRVGRKTHCSLWLLKGECGFAQSGCIYKHEMPLDLAGLEACGLRDIPPWYQKLYDVPSLNVQPGMQGPSVGLKDSRATNSSNWRARPDQGAAKTSDNHFGGLARGGRRRHTQGQHGNKYQSSGDNVSSNGSTVGDHKAPRRANTAVGNALRNGNSNSNSSSSRPRPGKDLTEREAREAKLQEMARAQDAVEELRREMMMAKYPSLAPGRSSVFTARPITAATTSAAIAYNAHLDSEAECESIFSGYTKHAEMTDSEFAREDRLRRDYVEAGDSSTGGNANRNSKPRSANHSHSRRGGGGGGGGGSNSSSRRRHGQGNVLPRK